VHSFIDFTARCRRGNDRQHKGGIDENSSDEAAATLTD
jgi:hypothetical protein